MATKNAEKTPAPAVDLTQMNVWAKLLNVRSEFYAAGAKKTGKNLHAEFKYFELEDIVPVAAPIFTKYGLLMVTSFTENAAVATIINIDNDEDKIVFTLPFIVKLGDRRFRDRMLKDASDNDLLVIRANCFDSDPYLINCVNGTYDLKSMEFREHDWRDFLTKQTNFEYTVQDIRCPRWEAFIKEVTMDDNDKAEYLQKALGYSMLGLANE